MSGRYHVSVMASWFSAVAVITKALYGWWVSAGSKLERLPPSPSVSAHTCGPGFASSHAGQITTVAELSTYARPRHARTVSQKPLMRLRSHVPPPGSSDKPTIA